MRADPADQLRLLEIQELDARADLLRHQRASLPELAEIASVRTARAALEAQARDIRILVEDLTREQQKADADVEQVKARRERDRDRMDRGLVSNPKDLQRMQQELVSLERRITALEDTELEIMERLEEAQQRLASVMGQIEAADGRLEQLTAHAGTLVRGIDEELASVRSRRDPLATVLPTDLGTLYERLRQSKGGVGAAPVRARACGGCRLALDNAELAAFKAADPDQVLRCEECQRILVRTAESGL